MTLGACGLASPHTAAPLQMPGEQLRPGTLSQCPGQCQPAGSPSTGAPEKAARVPGHCSDPGTPQLCVCVGGGFTMEGAGLAPMKAPGYTTPRLPTWTWARSLVTPGHNTEPGESVRETQSSQHSLRLCLIMSYEEGSL